MPGTGQPARSPRLERCAAVASLGGLAVIWAVLGGVPAGFCVPLLLVQHGRAGDDAGRLAGQLQRRTARPVRTASPGMTAPVPGATVIPPGYHATLGPVGRFHLGSRQSCTAADDAILSSVAQTVGPAVIAAVRTGRLHHGTEGARAIKRHGGRVLAQEPATARAGDMPSVSIATGCVDFVLAPERTESALVALTMAPRPAEMFSRGHTPCGRGCPDNRPGKREHQLRPPAAWDPGTYGAVCGQDRMVRRADVPPS